MITPSTQRTFLKKLLVVAGIIAVSPYAFSQTNLALSRTVTASPGALLAAANAVDGNQGTRWESAHANAPAWFQVDLGSTQALGVVEINWEAANARNYEVMGSVDGLSWSPLAAVTGGAFGTRTDRLAVSGNYRYLRLNLASRSAGNLWGYSIWELKVYAPGASIPSGTATSLMNGVTASASPNALRPAANAVDSGADRAVTRWESAHGVDSAYLQLDLGANRNLRAVSIDWEAANAGTYRVLGLTSPTATPVEIATVSGGLFGNRNDFVPLQGSYRYLRIQGVSRSVGNFWGYSIFDIRVYGSTASGGVPSSSSSLSSSVRSSVPSSSSVVSSSIRSSIVSSSSSVRSVTPSSSSRVSSSIPSSSSLRSSSVASSSSVVSSSVRSSSSVASSRAGTWELVWQDEFNGTTIDTSKWDYRQNCWGGGNSELQCYTNRATNAFVQDGSLNIVARRESFTGPDSADGTGTVTKTLPFTSASLLTKGKQDWTFGRFVARIKLPAGQGTWPAFWMLPTNSPYGRWAASGEIDIMEAVNLKVVTNGSEPEKQVHGTLHYGRAWPGNDRSGVAYDLPNNANPADDFHEYAVEWEDGEIRWYVDGVHYATQREAGWYSQYILNGVLTDAPVGAPFDSNNSKFHLILNLAVGGNWAGNVNNHTAFKRRADGTLPTGADPLLPGVDPSIWPQTMLVDYVRVYQCGASPSTGKGCATIGANATFEDGNERPPIVIVQLPPPPLLLMYDNSLLSVLRFGSYNPSGTISQSQITETGRGSVWNVVKTREAEGNVSINVPGEPVSLTNWSDQSELVFDYKVNSLGAGSRLLVKIYSMWPNVSDVNVPVDQVGQWREFRITLADLIDNGNSLATGRADLNSIVNLLVVEPTGAMNVSFDNVRIEGRAR